ncbi:IMS domain-containing protein [Synechococcus sp. RS9916]|uniref:IMS domain-containing protein n=1 Tax=Synechococcus sp. RS9916 TaxID=221359 RepID=UPI0000E53521|nr:IMS domain-containing protein [Synechococcus sp. RS9916]EAU74429.1 hypothetical protein RS9916_33017 [Synechococcus sp. RS9916]
MELPIDHFRLLGVSPSAEAETMLRTLQLRIDRPPSQGFTHEALQQRAELLRLSADLLTDPARRRDYEAALLDLGQEHPGETAGLDLSFTRELAGLILLWEASAPHEAFQLARQALQPPQAPALGSNREADLALLAALACRDASRQDQESRRYESAAGLLTEGMQLLQRVGKLADQRQAMEQELQQLSPYRVLDLLSRDLAEQVARQQGLEMLDQLVTERGGLEGTAFSEDSGGLSQGEFELFFQQIRRFLTAQEQLDLYKRWQRSGSSDAAFLQVMALTAAGFSRRKPERLDEARQQLSQLTIDGLDLLPLQGCLDLLLGDVDRAQNRMLASADNDLQQWLLKHPGDDLAALCDYCKAWLKRDVLPGFRDVDAEAVDLEAWFADRDVQAFVERLERIEGRQLSQSTDTSPTSAMGDAPLPAFPLDPNGTLPLPLTDAALGFAADGTTGPAQPTEATDDDHDADVSLGWRDQFARLPRPQWSMPALTLPRLEPANKPLMVGSAVFAGVVVLVGAFSLVGLKDESQSTAEQSDKTEQPQTTPQTSATLQPPQATLQPEHNDRPDRYGLKVTEPSSAQLQGLLQTWLNRKAAVLSGGSLANARLADVARSGLLDQVENERTRDAAAGTTQKVEASITSMAVVSSTPARIELRAQVAYRDERLNEAGKVIERTAATTYPITYVLGRDADQWRLAAYWRTKD